MKFFTIEIDKQKLQYSLWGLAIIIVLIIIFKLTQRKKKITDDIPIDFHKNRTYNKFEYDTLAEKMYDALHGWGTKTKEVLEVIYALKTPEDWYELNKAYAAVTPDKMSLTAHLYYDLSDNPDTEEKVKKYLKSIGVVF